MDESRWGRSAVLLAALSACLVSVDARAEAVAPTLAPASAERAPSDVERRPSELGLGALEVVTGVTLGVGGIGGAIAIADWDHDAGIGLAAALLLALPALQGLAICGVGHLSPHYDGGCLWPIGGAYLGAVALFPVAFLAGNASDGPLEGALTVVIGLGMGVLIGAPVGATWAWNAKKEWRGAEGAPSSRSTVARSPRSRFVVAAPTVPLAAPPLGPPMPAPLTFRLFAAAF